MLSLDDLQARVGEAVLTGDVKALATVVTGGGGDATRRLAIHSRHYTASLVTSLVARFPATVWLLGSEPVTAAAREFVRHQPPSKPCIAEYGEGFPDFLSARIGRLPYVGQFATLEWHAGRLSLAIEHEPLVDLSGCNPVAMADGRVHLQPGVSYLRLDWPLDELLSFYLRDASPSEYTLVPGGTWLEVRGVRGELRMNRLTMGAFTFRRALSEGLTLGDAALAGIEAEAIFNPIHELMGILHEGLVVAVGVGEEGVRL